MSGTELRAFFLAFALFYCFSASRLVSAENITVTSSKPIDDDLQPSATTPTATEKAVTQTTIATNASDKPVPQPTAPTPFINSVNGTDQKTSGTSNREGSSSNVTYTILGRPCVNGDCYPAFNFSCINGTCNIDNDESTLSIKSYYLGLIDTKVCKTAKDCLPDLKGVFCSNQTCQCLTNYKDVDGVCKLDKPKSGNGYQLQVSSAWLFCILLLGYIF